MPEFRVVDLRNAATAEYPNLVPAASPEQAARSVLGFDVVRSGPKQNLVARAYWQYPDQPINMVRLYRRVGEMPAN